jgi:alkylated DNA nucleotide flippase Atl1
MAMTALQKLRRPQEVKIVNELPAGALNWGPPGATMVISTPLEIDSVVQQIPKGKLATFDALKQVIATRHGTTITCPVTTGIFLGTVARASAEQEMMGAKRVTPWWRVVRTDGTLNETFPGGVAEHEKRLVGEGHKIEAKGKSKRAVAEFEKKLALLQA